MARTALGLDFGTTNSVVALANGNGTVDMVEFEAPDGASVVFRSALCFWEEQGVQVEAGPWAIAEYLEYPEGSRFIQSFKSVAASAAFEHAWVFGKRMDFADLGRAFLERLVSHGGAGLSAIPERIVVGRPIEYAGGRPDPALARQRYDAMFAGFGTDIHYVYEPIGAAFSYARRLSEPATILVADFGGGTSDFSVVRVEAPGAARRCIALGNAGVGIAGDRFDYRIVDYLVLPLIGKGGSYRSFDKLLEIPHGYFSDFGDWSRLALMRNRRTLEALRKLQHSAEDPAAIGRMLAIIENELGYRLYDAVGQLKRALSSGETAEFRFTGGGVDIAAEVRRDQFEGWIAPDLAKIEMTVDRALAAASTSEQQVDRVFLTGGSSLIPAVQRMFERRFGAERIGGGGELTSIAHGLAMVAQEEDVEAWSS